MPFNPNARPEWIFGQAPVEGTHLWAILWGGVKTNVPNFNMPFYFYDVRNGNEFYKEMHSKFGNEQNLIKEWKWKDQKFSKWLIKTKVKIGLILKNKRRKNFFYLFFISYHKNNNGIVFNFYNVCEVLTLNHNLCYILKFHVSKTKQTRFL